MQENILLASWVVATSMAAGLYLAFIEHDLFTHMILNFKAYLPAGGGLWQQPQHPLLHSLITQNEIVQPPTINKS